MSTTKLTKKQVTTAAKEHGLFVTDNHGSIHAAKNLFTANKRIIELESILAITDDIKRNAAIFKYNHKWNK